MDKAPGPLALFETLLAHPDPAALDSVLVDLDAAGLVEEALVVFKRVLPGPERSRSALWRSLQSRLADRAETSRERRMSLWQRDTRRCNLRMAYQVLEPRFPAGIQAAIALACEACGYPVALGLEKTPRPMVQLAHPLPPGATGLREWADVSLREHPAEPMDVLRASLNRHLAPTLQATLVQIIPNHASPAAELCREARWSWPCPVDRAPAARARLEAFRLASTWEIDKTGKVEGHKVLKRIEVRHLVTTLAWEGDRLHIGLRIGAGEALSPAKLLAGLLEVEPAAIQGLVRQEVLLGEDPRLAHPDAFEPKLHNMYEDAVLLEWAPPARPGEEDDDEPIILDPRRA
jgi:hypothetical protein